MSDLIRREDVKEILRTEWVKLFPVELDPYLSLAMEKIENIPSTEQWIPLKEKLPNDEQRVLLSSMGGVELVTWDEDSKRLYRDCRNLVVAWMPLPEPHEEADG